MHKFHKSGKDYLTLRKEAICLFDNGLNRSDIARKLELSMHAVGKWLRKAGKEYSKTGKIDIDSNIFNVINNEEKAYWLGFLYADGYVSKIKEFELSLSLKDIGHLEKFKSFLKFKGKIYVDKKLNRGRVHFQDSEIVTNLIKKGCLNKKSLILKFPTEEQVPKEFISHFIRGYFDGDGHINSPSKPINVSMLGTYSILSGIHNILQLPISKIYHPIRCKSEYIFESNLCGNFARLFCDFIYNNSTICLDRKYERYKKHLIKHNEWKNRTKFKNPKAV